MNHIELILGLGLLILILAYLWRRRGNIFLFSRIKGSEKMSKVFSFGSRIEIDED